jgi:hypothetical protein
MGYIAQVLTVTGPYLWRWVADRCGKLVGSPITPSCTQSEHKALVGLVPAPSCVHITLSMFAVLEYSYQVSNSADIPPSAQLQLWLMRSPYGLG